MYLALCVIDFESEERRDWRRESLNRIFAKLLFLNAVKLYANMSAATANTLCV